jgi:ABC-type amino acid transport system permease subunit
MGEMRKFLAKGGAGFTSASSPCETPNVNTAWFSSFSTHSSKTISERHTTTPEDARGDAGTAAGALWRRLPLIAILAAALALQARVFLLVWRYSVNILCQDQWDFYIPLFKGMPVSQFFLWRIGPVRQGIGFLVYKYVSELSGWDTRVEGLVMSGIVFAALLCALWLKRRLLGPFTYWDLAIPPLFLTPVLTGVYTMIPNPSHGPFPLLLVVLYCLAWSWQSNLKYPLIVLVNFLLIFTTFGLIMGFITPPLLALDCYRAARGKRTGGLIHPSLALLLSLLSLAFFFVGYSPDPALECFQFPYPRPLEYIWYVGLMFACFWRFAWSGILPLLVGVPLFLLIAALCARHAYLLLRDRATDRRASLVITALTGYSLLFSINAAVGRICMGLHTAQAARYMPYLIPAFLALYFQLLTLKARPRRAALGLFLAASALLTAPLSGGGAVVLEQFRRGKTEWKRCYLEIENVAECDARTNFKVYSPIVPSSLEERMIYLKRNRLNLYAGDK